MKKRKVFLLVFLIICFLKISNSYCDSYVVTEIANNAYINAVPQINVHRHITWQGGNGYGADVDSHLWDAQGHYNGRFIVESMIEKKGGDISEQIAGTYIYGVLDTIRVLAPDFFASTYANTTKGDIVDAVKLYYKNNPTQRHRSVIDVMMSGCK